jgi:hypothetical protein
VLRDPALAEQYGTRLTGNGRDPLDAEGEKPR